VEELQETHRLEPGAKMLQQQVQPTAHQKKTQSTRLNIQKKTSTLKIIHFNH
jgi:hypothetical protein